MTDISFSRDEMLPQSAPPAGQTGIVLWLRERMFSGWFNSILSLVCLYIFYRLIAWVLPWLLHGVWNASSRIECVEIVQRRWGADASGACFAVIHDRWQQFLFGFYPPELYWRPTLAFILLLVALAPILFSGLPRKMLWFSLAFPGVAAWLLWGGSLLVPVAIYLGPVLAVLLYRAIDARGSTMLARLAAVAFVLIWWLYCAGPLGRALGDFLALTPVSSKQFGGFMLSITIGVTGIAFSLPLGVLLALGRRSDMFLVKTLSVGFIEFIRGVPLITLLLVASYLLNIFMPPGTNFDIILRVIIMVTLFSAAYMAEVIRGGLAALPKGQYEGADALGLDYWKSMRLVIMPQALKISTPGIVNTFIGLFKDTTLVSIIGLLDPLGLITSVRSNQNWNGLIWELYGFVGLMFFICCFSMSKYSQYLERKLRTDRR